MYTEKDHTFVICAYKTCEYLEECIKSLMTQTVKSTVLMSTSTPNDHIRTLAEKYNIPLFVNEGEKGIAQDWNFALKCAETDLITLAHQDDVYKPAYTEYMLKCINRAKTPIFFFSRYGEIRNGKEVFSSTLLDVKNILCAPLAISGKSKFAKWFCLAFGDGILCPSVTYVRSIILNHLFESDMKCSLDWEEYSMLAKLPGSIVYSSRPLLLHRIHSEAETTKFVENNARVPEDYQMFLKYWPAPVAKILTRLYSRGERTYQNEFKNKRNNTGS